MTSTLEALLWSYPVGKVELGPRKAVEMSQNTKDLLDFNDFYLVNLEKTRFLGYFVFRLTVVNGTQDIFIGKNVL